MSRTDVVGRVALCVLLASVGAPNAAADPVDDLLKDFAAQGAGNFSAQAGERFWDHPVTDPKSGEVRRCSLCHSDDLRRSGKHATTGKVIEPLAPRSIPSACRTGRISKSGCCATANGRWDANAPRRKKGTSW